MKSTAFNFDIGTTEKIKSNAGRPWKVTEKLQRRHESKNKQAASEDCNTRFQILFLFQLHRQTF